MKTIYILNHPGGVVTDINKKGYSKTIPSDKSAMKLLKKLRKAHRKGKKDTYLALPPDWSFEIKSIYEKE